MTYQSVHPIIIEIYCELQLHVQQFLHSWNFAVTNDIKTCNNFLQKNELIWVMRYIYHTLTFTIIFFSCSLMHNFLHAKRLPKVIWHETHIYFTYRTTIPWVTNLLHTCIRYHFYKDKLLTHMKWQFFTHITLLSDMCAFIPLSKLSQITRLKVVFKIIHHTYIRTF